MIGGFKEQLHDTDIARTLQARDYKGVSNQGITLVYEKLIDAEDKKRNK